MPEIQFLQIQNTVFPGIPWPERIRLSVDAEMHYCLLVSSERVYSHLESKDFEEV